MAIAPPPAALKGLITKHYRPLVCFLRSRVGCEETAVELAQETCLRLARMADRGHIRDLSSYLFRTAENLTIDHLREMERSGTVARFSAETLEIADPTPSPEQRVADGKRLAIVERAIAELDLLARKIFILSRFLGHSHERIAQDLGISKSCPGFVIYREQQLFTGGTDAPHPKNPEYAARP